MDAAIICSLTLCLYKPASAAGAGPQAGGPTTGAEPAGEKKDDVIDAEFEVKK